MNYYLEHREGIAKEGYIAALIICLLLLIWFWFWTMSPVTPPKTVQGMLINFGQVETGSGKETPNSSEQLSNPPPVEAEEVADNKPASTPNQSTPAPSVQKKVQEVKGESPALATEKKEKKEDKKEKDKKKKSEAQETIAEETQPAKVEKKPEIDPNTLFSSRNKTNNNSQSTSQGLETQNSDAGNVTDEEFSDQNSDTFTPSRNIGMTDNGTVKTNLQGRNLLSSPKIKDNSQKEGRIVVKIKVDNTGKVIDASFNPGGSSTSDATLKSLAIKAAKDSKFNFDLDAPAVQSGTMTFTFKVR